ncbi:MAG: xanthine dehydrogenase family protein subunit M [Betaproteobacteria bacterium]|nr:xanthine dehydrogenase family protein subunit M [Betaproteobacteria bacterium]
MKPAPFDYHCPQSLAEALHLLATLHNARPLAGGQSLMPMMNLRLATPSHLVDLGRIAELAGIEETAIGIRIGAMTTQRTLERSALIRAHCPLLAEALQHVGHQQTRNRGTLGGSLCHLDPAAELPIVAAALGASLSLSSSAGSRTLSFADFPAGYLTSVLDAGELLTHVELPRMQENSGWCFEEFSRRPADFAIVAVAAQVRLGPLEEVTEVRIAIGGLAYAPLRIEAAEQALVGQTWSAERVERAASLAGALPAEGDDDNTPAYRQHLAGVLTRRALRKAFNRCRERAHV